MTITESYTNDPFLSKHIKGYNLFVSDSKNEKDTYIVVPTIYRTILLGINCHFRVSKTKIYIEESSVLAPGHAICTLLNQDTHYLVQCQGKPKWVQITINSFSTSNFSLKKSLTSPSYEILSKSLRNTTLSVPEYEVVINDYLKKIYVFDHLSQFKNALPLFQKGLSILSIAEQLHLSYRTFNRHFNEYLGINPSIFLRLLRFHNAFQKNSFIGSQNDLHYYDASHFTREHMYFTGYTPTQFQANFTRITSGFYVKK